MKQIWSIILITAFSVNSLFAQESDSSMVRLRDSLKTAKVVLARLDTLRIIAADDMLKKYRSYPNGPFATMNKELLDSLYFMGKIIDKRNLDGLVESVDTARTRLVRFNQANNVLEREYDKNNITVASNHLKAILPFCSSEQQEELNAVLELMALYPEALKRAYLIADWVAVTLKDIRNEQNPQDRNMAVVQVQSIFQNQDWEYQNSISKIPYLNGLYLAYQKAILENPFESNSYEVQLLNYRY